MENKRSDGILVLGIMAILFGIWSLLHYLGSELVTLRNPQLYSQLLQSGGILSARLTYFGSITNLIICPLFIISGFAVLKLKNWGRNLIILISIIQLINSLILPYIWANMMTSVTYRATVIPTPISILYIINIWFFCRKKTREQF